MMGRGDNGDCTSALSSPTLPSSKKPPVRSLTIAGNGVLASRSQVVSVARALSPSSLAQRSISGMPIIPRPKRCQICLGSAPTPWKRNNITSAKRPGSAEFSLAVSVDIGPATVTF